MVCVAGGHYTGGLKLGASGTAANPIVIKRSTASDPVCGSNTAGWNGSYDAQVVTAVTNGAGISWGTANFVTVDGVVASGFLFNVANDGSAEQSIFPME